MRVDCVRKRNLLFLFGNVLFCGLCTNKNLRILGVLFFFVHVSMLLFPYLQNKLNYSNSLQLFLFYSLYWLGIIPVIKNGFYIGCEIKSILFTLLFSTLLLIINKKKLRETINSRISLVPISVRNFAIVVLGELYSIVSQEFFFRLVVIDILKPEFGVLAVFASSLLFVITHYLNRKSSEYYDLTDYMNYFFLSLVLGVAYYVDSNFVACIIGHLVFNSGIIVLNWKRLGNKIDVTLFDDYEV